MLAAAPLTLSGQGLGTTIDVSAGYSRLYHAGGIDARIGVTKSIARNASVEHHVGIFLRHTSSELSSLLFVSDQRHLLGFGARYAAILHPAAQVAPFVGVTLQWLHSSTTDNVFVTGNGDPLPNPNAEDRVGLVATGPAGSAEGGLFIRIGRDVAATVRISWEYQGLYTNPTTHTVWGIATGIALAIR